MKKYLKEVISLFKKSFKFDKKMIYIILLDILFLFLASSVAIIMSIVFMTQAPDADQLQYVNTDEGLEMIKDFITFAIVDGIISILLFLLVWTGIKGLIWNIVLDKKVTKKFFWKFLLLNLIWIIITALLYGLVSITFKEQVKWWIMIIFAPLIILHFITLNYISFVKTNLLFKSMKSAFMIGIKKIHYLIVPYILGYVVFLAITVILIVLKYLPIYLYYLLFGLLMLSYFAWLRMYITKVVKKIK